MRLSTLALVLGCSGAGAAWGQSYSDPNLLALGAEYDQLPSASILELVKSGEFAASAVEDSALTTAYQLASNYVTGPNPLTIGSTTIYPGPTATSSTSVGGTGAGAATATIPAASSPVCNPTSCTYSLSNLTASASQLGITGAAGGGAAAAFDTLTFSGLPESTLETMSGTLNLTLTLTATGPNGSAFGGGCLAVGGTCNPTTSPNMFLTASNPTETLSVSVPLGAPALIFDTLYVLADNSSSISSGSIDPSLTLTLPPDVSFTAASGESGSGSPVPLPSAAWLLLSGLGAAGVLGRRRRRPY